jgi:hypothetical protein
MSKITRAKWTGNVTQAVEHLLYKHEALSTNINPTKKSKKERQLTTKHASPLEGFQQKQLSS